MEVIDKACCTEFTAQDGAIAHEILSPRNSSPRNQSLAEIRIEPGQSILEHYHIETEIYFILAGRGEMQIKGEVRNVGTDQVVAIPQGQRHQIRNTGETDLVMLVSCAPAYLNEDQVLIET
ncbi:cupin domain-containing protein [bacterium]|nr:cupin domain-containing protein [bacterium]